MPTTYKVLRGLTAASRVADEYLKQEHIKENEIGINDLSETGNLARVILDIFPKRGGENAIRLARAIRTMIITTIAEAEEKPAAPAIPPGWTPANETPDDDRNVGVMCIDGDEKIGWHGDVGDKVWRVYRDDDLTLNPAKSIVTTILCWRELHAPAPKLAVGDTFTVTFTMAEDGTWFSVAPGHIPARSKSGLDYGIKLSDIDGQEVAK